MTRRPCPCCGDATEPMYFIHKVELAPIAGVTVINAYDVAQCAICGMCFATGIPDQATVSRYYAQASKYTTVSDSDRKRHDATAEAIRTYLSPPATTRILDVGAGAGGLSEALAPLTVVGVDSLDDIAPCHLGAFDGAILSGVLEHVVDVKPLLLRIRDLLTPDGWLWVEVPNAAGWPPEGEAPRATPFQEFSSEHINYFTDESLAHTLMNAGFDVCGDIVGVTEQTPTQSAAHLVTWAQPRQIAKDRAPIEAYVADSATELGRYIAAAHALPSPCILWGAGTLTRRLWPHLEAKAFLVVDSNTAYHGKRIGNTLIADPSEAAQYDLPVIALTQGAVDSIQDAAATLGVTATALLDFDPR